MFMIVPKHWRRLQEATRATPSPASEELLARGPAYHFVVRLDEYMCAVTCFLLRT